MNIRPSNRVHQLEAHSLDQSFVSIVDEYVDSLKLERFGEELKIVLKLYSTLNHVNDGETIGMQVYQMRYFGQNKLKRILLTCSNLIIPYIAKKSDQFQNLLSESTHQQYGLNMPWLSIDNIILLLRGLSVINFLNFLRSGKNLTLQEKVFNMIPGLSEKAHNRGVATNKVQMELMYRVIVWKVIAEFLTTTIPLINFSKVKNQLLKMTGFLPKMTNQIKLAEKILAQSQSGYCAICNKQPFNPFIIGCRHVFCYYCLHSNNEDNYICLQCNYCTEDNSQVQRFKTLVSAE